MSFERFNYNFAQRIADYQAKFANLPKLSLDKDEAGSVTSDLAGLLKVFHKFDESFAQPLLNFIARLATISPDKSLEASAVYDAVIHGLDDGQGQHFPARFSSYQQAALLEFIYTRNLGRQVLKDQSLLRTEDYKDASDCNWQRCSYTQAGAHTLGHNSDYYINPKSGSALMALLCDGVTASDTENGLEALAGRAAARRLAQQFADGVDAQFDTAKLGQGQAKIDTAKDLITRILLDIYWQNLAIVNDSEFSDEVSIKDTIDNLTSATTLVAAIDLGDDILLVSLGDSRIFALNAWARVMSDSVNQVSKDENGVFAFGHVMKDGVMQDTSWLLGQALSFSTVAKDKAWALVLASDGITRPYQQIKEVSRGGELISRTYILDVEGLNESLADSYEQGPSKIVRDLLHRSFNSTADDQTVQVLVRKN